MTSRYDRQIRLWGKSAQLRLMQTSIYFNGILRVASEIAKNLVLSGVHCVDVKDTSMPSHKDYQTNFLLQGAPLSLPAGSSCIPSLQRLNPFVKVSTTELEPYSHSVLVQETENLENIKDTLNACYKIELFVFLIPVMESVVVLFFYSNSSRSLTAQLDDFLDSHQMHRKPPLVQKASLLLHLNAVKGNDPFVLTLVKASALVTQLQTYALADSDLEDLACTSSPSMDVCGCTISGAVVAQHIVNQITASERKEQYQWMAYDSKSGSVYYDVLS